MAAKKAEEQAKKAAADAAKKALREEAARRADERAAATRRLAEIEATVEEAAQEEGTVEEAVQKNATENEDNAYSPTFSPESVNRGQTPDHNGDDTDLPNTQLSDTDEQTSVSKLFVSVSFRVFTNKITIVNDRFGFGFGFGFGFEFASRFHY